MLIRLTVLCAAVAALSACTGFAPAPKTDAPAKVSAAGNYPSEHNQFRELGWE